MRAKKSIPPRFRPQLEVLEARELLTTYIVAPNGSDSNNGISAPFLTIQHAANVVRAGDTVEIESGTYAGFDVQTSGTATAPIIFEAAPGATVTIDSPEGNRKDCGINIEDWNNGDPMNYITIKGLDINNANGNLNFGIRAVWNGSVNSTGVQFLDNTVTNCDEFGLFTSHEDNLLIEGNSVSGTKGTGDNGHGIYVSNACFDPHIIGNTLFDNQSLGLHMNGDASEGPAVEPDGTSDGNNGNIIGAVVEDNVIYDNGLNGINCDGLQNSVIEDNLLYNNGGGIVLYQIDAAAPSTNNVIADNTVTVLATDNFGNEGRWDIQIMDGNSAGSINNVVFDNILINQNPNHGSIEIGPLSLTGFHSDYNVITTSGDSGSSSNNAFDLVDSSGNDHFVSMTQWQSQTGQDMHSITADSAQLFVNPSWTSSSGNYQLSSTSPAIGKGIGNFQGDLAPSTDLLGNSRPSSNGFDIGAYEYQTGSSSQSPTITAGPSANPSPVTGTTTNLSVQASDPNGDSMTYTWIVTQGSSGVTFSANGTAAASNTTATFPAAGNYTFQVTVLDSGGFSTVGTVGVTVQQTASSLVVTPATASVADGASQAFTAKELDQFSQAMTSQPAIAWSVSGSGSINPTTGRYTAPAFGTGTATVNANAGGFSGHAAVTVTTIPQSVYVSNVYEKLLGRAADVGAAYWVNLLDNGVAPSMIVLDIEQSTEYLTDVVNSIYEHYLHRTADSSGSAYWVSQLSGGATIEQVTASIVASPEYYALHGSTNTGFVKALYQDILNRAADSTGLAAWVNFLNSGGSRYQAALGFLTSTEYRTDLIESDYSTYLLRSADPVGLASWLQALQAGLNDQALLAAIFGSAEGYAKWS